MSTPVQSTPVFDLSMSASAMESSHGRGSVELDAQARQVLVDRCVAIIDRFEHRQALREGDIRHWVPEVVNLHGHMAPWHAARAGGFGGSDIGTLVRNFQGVRADHKDASAHNIVESKLLRRLPDGDSGPLRRGNFMEPIHAQFFRHKWMAERDEASFAALKTAKGSRSWMRYSPDELVYMPSDEPNEALGGQKLIRVLADYKAPGQVDDANEVSFQYACQLHQGAILCAEAGIHLDALQLSQFDWVAWRLKDDFVAWDPDLAQVLVQAGDHYWDCVLRAEVPRYVVKEALQTTESFEKRFGVLANVLANLKATQKALEAVADEASDLIKKEFEHVRLGSKKVVLQDITISAVQKVKHDAVTQALLSCGVTPEQLELFRKKGTSATALDVDLLEAGLRSFGVTDFKPFRKFEADDEKAYPFLVERGFDADALIEEQLRIAPAKHVKEAAQAMVGQMFNKQDLQPAPVEPELLGHPPVVLGDLDGVGQSEEMNSEGHSSERHAPRI